MSAQDLFLPREASSRFSSMCFKLRVRRCSFGTVDGMHPNFWAKWIPSAGLSSVLMSRRPAASGWWDMADCRKACGMISGSRSRHLSLSMASSHLGASPRCSSTTFWMQATGVPKHLWGVARSCNAGHQLMFRDGEGYTLRLEPGQKTHSGSADQYF